MGPIVGVFIIVLTALAFSPASAGADWREFIPRPYENHADIEVGASYESEDNRVGDQGRKWRDIFLREKLTLYSDGYVYHPRFAQYHLSLSGALKQEDYTQGNTPSQGWTFTTGVEYDAKLMILPEHPYRLKLFALRQEPLYRTYSAPEINRVVTERGALFEYKNRPYFFNASYRESTGESTEQSNNVKVWEVDASYAKDFRNGFQLSQSAQYVHQSFSTTTPQSDGTSNGYFLTNLISWRSLINLQSFLSKNTFDQQGSTVYRDDQINWTERLTATLPLNFHAGVSYDYRKDTNTFGSGLQESGMSSTDKRFHLDINQKLYQSLFTTYYFQHETLTSSIGDQVNTSHLLSTLYTKRIPWGTLSAGITLSRLTVEQTGQTAIINENHASIAVPGFFDLNVQLVDPTTIQVFLRSPVPPSELILLEENIHYTVVPFGNTFRITVFNLPSPFIIPGAYDFVVSYALSAGNFKEQTDSFGFNISANLFNDLVHPYFNYSTSTTEVLSGNFPGTPPTSTEYTAGVILYRDPWRVLAQYRKFDSNVNPFREWKGEVAYSRNITETSRLYAMATYTDTHYLQSPLTGIEEGYSYKSFIASANIYKHFWPKYLILSGGGSYSYAQDLINTTQSYSLNASLVWKVGKFTVIMNASGSAADTNSRSQSVSRARRIHQYHTLKIIRKLF